MMEMIEYKSLVGGELNHYFLNWINDKIHVRYCDQPVRIWDLVISLRHHIHDVGQSRDDKIPPVVTKTYRAGKLIVDITQPVKDDVGRTTYNTGYLPMSSNGVIDFGKERYVQISMLFPAARALLEYVDGKLLSSVPKSKILKAMECAVASPDEYDDGCGENEDELNDLRESHIHRFLDRTTARLSLEHDAVDFRGIPNESFDKIGLTFNFDDGERSREYEIAFYNGMMYTRCIGVGLGLPRITPIADMVKIITSNRWKPIIIDNQPPQAVESERITYIDYRVKYASACDVTWHILNNPYDMETFDPSNAVNPHRRINTLEMAAREVMLTENVDDVFAIVNIKDPQHHMWVAQYIFNVSKGTFVTAPCINIRYFNAAVRALAQSLPNNLKLDQCVSLLT